MIRRAIILAAALAAYACPAAAANYHVYPDGSGDAPTIQAAIDMAVSGDGIVVHRGIYYESDILVEGKDLTFTSSGGIAVIISPVPGANTGITITDATGAFILTGLEFRDFLKGVVIDSASPTVWFSNLRACGTGIELAGVSTAPQVMFCLVDSCGTGISVTGADNALLRNLTVVNCSTGASFSGGSVDMGRNIVYGCDTGVSCSGGSASLSCNDFWLNGVDYSGCPQGAGDFKELPRFCFEAGGSPGPYYLHEESPCWAENNGCGVDLGAFTQLPGCTGTAVKTMSWGAIKNIHR